MNTTLQPITEAQLVAGIDANGADTFAVTLTQPRVMGLPQPTALGRQIRLVVTNAVGGNALSFGAGFVPTTSQINNLSGSVTEVRITCVAQGSWTASVFALNPPQGPTVIYGGVTDASIRAAALQAKALGGGTVIIGVPSPWAKIPLTAPLPRYSGVRYVGTIPQTITQNPANGSYSQGFEWNWVGGTVLSGNGTFSAFAPDRIGNGTGADDADLANAQVNVGNTELTNMSYFGIGFDNFSRGLSAGAQNVMGWVHGTFDELYFKNCGWAMYEVNFGALLFGKVYACGDPVAGNLGQNGFYFAQKGNQNVLGLCGSMRGEMLFWVRPRVAGNHTGRNIVFEALGVAGGQAGLSEIMIGRVESDMLGGAQGTPTLVSVVATISSGSPNIVLPAGTGAKLRVGMQVWFTASGSTFNGLNEPLDSGFVTYVITSIVGDTIQLSGSRYGAAINGGANEAPTMQTYGFSNVEIIADAASTVTNVTIEQLDSEGYNSSIYMDRTGGLKVRLSTPASQAVGPHMIGKNVGESEFYSAADIKTDFDNLSVAATFDGFYTQRWGYGLRGKYKDISSGHNVFKQQAQPAGKVNLSGYNANVTAGQAQDLPWDGSSASITFPVVNTGVTANGKLFTVGITPAQTNPPLVDMSLELAGNEVGQGLKPYAQAKTGGGFDVYTPVALAAGTYTLKLRTVFPS